METNETNSGKIGRSIGLYKDMGKEHGNYKLGFRVYGLEFRV